VSRFSAWSLLAVFGIGVFLAGLELMITATALPSILLDLAVTDQLGKPAFSELRHASWIVNGYLLAYVVAMPLAGRLADVWGTRRLFLVALVVFIAGSLVAGRGQTIDELIIGRVIQGIGGGILVPVGTAAASHLFEGHDRPRALGIIGALTFLGMAAGPFLGAALLGGLDIGSGLDRLGIAPGTPLHDALAPAWRWVFYINVPIGLVALFVAWAASHGWETPRRRAGLDIFGALVWSVALAAALGATTLIGIADLGGPDPLIVAAGLSTFVSIERVRSGAHFPTDVIAGSIAGAGIGVVVPHLHRTEDIKQRRVWVGYTAAPSDGYQQAQAQARTRWLSGSKIGVEPTTATVTG